MEREEQQIDNQLNEFLHDPELPELASVCAVLEGLDPITVKLLETVDKAAGMADSISAKIRELDQEQMRLKNALEHVETSNELRTIFEDLLAAMKDDQHELAAVNIHRFLVFDEVELKELDKQDMLVFDDDGTVSLNDALSEIEKSRQRLLQTSNERIDQASKDGNDEQILKYWKLFPLLMETERGLEKFGRFLIMEVRKAFEIPLNIGEKGGASFVQVTTRLFEIIAALIDAQSPRVKEVYGPGMMLYILRKLEGEAVSQYIKILDTLSEKRSISRLHDEIQQKKSSDDPAVTVQTVASLLDEMAMICQKMSQFCRFMYIRGKSEVESILKTNEANDESRTSRSSRHLLKTLLAAPGFSVEHGLIKSSEMQARTKEIMSIHYLEFESFFITNSVNKALELDSFDQSGDELISSAVEDCFYIMKNVVSRAFSTYDVDTICVILNLISKVLEEDYLKQGLKKKIAVLSSVDYGSEISDDPKSQLQYLILMNNIDQSSSYVKKLCNEIENGIENIVHFASPRLVAEKLKSCLFPISESTALFQRTLNRALENLFNLTLKVKVKTVIAESIGFMKLNINEDEYSSLSQKGNGTHVFQAYLQNALGSHLFQEFGKMMSKNNYSGLCERCCLLFTHEVEQYLLNSNSKINHLGALQMDKNIRSAAVFFGSLTNLTMAKEHFHRLNSMATVLSLDNASEATHLELTQLKLSPREVQKLISARFGLEAASKIITQ